VKRKRLGNLLQTTRAAPGRGRSLDRRRSPKLRGDVVGRLLEDLGESDTSRDTATLSQRRSRGLASLVGRYDLPQVRRGRRERKGRWAWKYREEVGER
jgi:hypothetical protein